MKYSYKLAALLCAMALWATSCTKEMLDEPSVGPDVKGNEIVFGARAGFENGNPDSRTVYSGDTYTSNGATFERIDWVTGDVVEIYSPQATGTNPAHYTVTQDSVDPDGNEGNSTGDQHDEGYLTKLSEGGLQWGSNEQHTFYAMYPSQGDNATLGINGDKINATIPNEQHAVGAKVTTTNDLSHYEFMPDMRFAYMVAKKNITPATTSVSLDFKPIVTAIRVELRLPTAEEVKESNSDVTSITIPDTRIFSVRLSGKGLVGDFTADLSTWDGENGYPTITAGADANEQSITSILKDNDGELVVLKAGESLAFTVFVRLTEAFSLSNLNLKVSFSPDGQNYKTQGIESTSTIMPLKKTSLKGIKLPYTKTTFSYANWMKDVQDTALIQNLSMPGTGGSFSYAYKESDAAYYQQQTLPIFTGESGYEGKTGQWEMGIRAFEMACDRPSGSTVDEPGSLDAQDIMVNGKPMSWTVGAAIRALLDKVSDSEETAMVIITYQPQAGTGLNRHAGIFAGALANLYDALIAESDGKYAGKFVLYTSETVMEDATQPEKSARGKLMIVARVNQRGEGEHSGGSGINTNGSSTSTEYYQPNWETAVAKIGDRPILLVNGCGTAKDRWYARGYQVSADGVSYVDVGDVAKNANPTQGQDVEYYMLGQCFTDGIAAGTRPIIGGTYYNDGEQYRTFPEWYVKVTEGGNYGFGTNHGTQQVWYQEWARVVNLDYIHAQGGEVKNGYYERGSYPTHGWYDTEKLKSNNNAIRWKESYSEKVADAKATFDMAIGSAQEESPYANYVFINSLCGYLVDPGIHRSWKMFAPSMGAGITGESTSSRYDWWGGLEGNIYELAWRINAEFGAYVLDVISAQGERGATGVVMMDRLSEDVSAGASNYLPSVIITNNLYSGAFGDTGLGGGTGTGGGTDTGGGTGTGGGDNEQPGGGNEEDGI